MRRGFKNTATSIGELDYTVLTCYIALVMVGWLMIYSASYSSSASHQFFDLGNIAGKQLFFIILCAVMLFFIQMSDWTFWRTLAFPIYLFSLVLLAGTIVFGREVNGANAWYQFGGFSFQPSEIAKFSTCLAVASYLSATGVTLRETKSRLYAIGLFMLPVVIILLQKDTGSALVFFSFLLVLYRDGLPSGAVRYQAPEGAHDDEVMALALATRGYRESLRGSRSDGLMGGTSVDDLIARAA